MFLVSPGCFMMSLLLVPKPQKNYWNSWSIPLKPKKYLFWSTSIVSLNLRVHGLEITWKLAFPWNVSAISQCTTFLRGNVPSLVASLVHLNHLNDILHFPSSSAKGSGCDSSPSLLLPRVPAPLALLSSQAPKNQSDLRPLASWQGRNYRKLEK